ncbi:MAG: polyisoprenoid-binding protein [Robiginitomaculum sp.]|nr:MAG: polyisoprenoid-binding protein [Robiginitomaculum sp.]
MKVQSLFITFVSVFLVSCYTPPNVERTVELAGNYRLDPAHASVVWSISHVGISNYTARFNDIRGTLSFDPTSPENSQIDISIDPASVSTGDVEFDKTIGMGASYFNAAQYPEIRFISRAITITGENTGIITGDLSFRGKTLPLSLSAVFNGAGKSFGHSGKTLGFSATGTLMRSDFGLTTLSSFGIGDEITVRIETEFNEN